MLSDNSLKFSIGTYKEKTLLGYDSLATVENLKKYLWHNGEPVNYNPDNHPRSQDLPNYTALNFAINVLVPPSGELTGAHALSVDKY